MECSNPGYLDGLFSCYLLSTNVKSASSWKLHRDFGATRKTTWIVNHRHRMGMVRQAAKLPGNIEVEESFMGGRRKNMGRKKRKALANLGLGTVRKVNVIGAISRKNGEVVLLVIPDARKETLRVFVEEVAQESVTVYADEHKGYDGLDSKATAGMKR